MDNYLPELDGVDPALRRNRSVKDGYARGWGLEFGGLDRKVHADKLYREAMKVASGRTIVAETRRMNLFLLVKFYLPRLARGHIVEFGAYKGGNAMFLAYVAERIAPGTQVYALDTYTGMPTTDKTVDAHNAGDFGDAPMEGIQRAIDAAGITNLHLVKGLFEDTAADLARDKGPFALAHIDCDIYSACQVAYDTVKPAMVAGGYIVFDDATVSSCIGATEAVENLCIRRDGLSSEQIHPHYVFRAPGAA